MEQFIKVKVHAGQKYNRIEQKAANALEVWVKAPAEQGRANEAVRTILANTLGIPENKLSLIKGATSPSKLFLQRG